MYVYIYIYIQNMKRMSMVETTKIYTIVWAYTLLFLLPGGSWPLNFILLV